MKKLFCILLGALMIASALTACSKPETAPVTTEAPITTTAPNNDGVTNPMEAKYESISIAGVDISQYTIVYAPDAYADAKRQYSNSFQYGVTHFEKLIAEEMAATIKNMIGVEMKVVEDSEAETANEILIGSTNRGQSSKFSRRDAADLYKLAVRDTKLCIEGASSAAMYDSMERFFAYLFAQNSMTVDMPAGYSSKGDADVIVIGCIGDSITQGVGASNGTYCSYPAILQRILWKDYAVVNYGNSGKTMREDLADAYIKCATYSDLKAGAAKVDIALIMLGTNDSNRDQQWNDNSTAKFEEGYRNLLNMLKSKNPEMTYFTMNCPVYGGGAQFGSETVRNLQRELTTTLQGEGWDLHFFDMYTYSKDVITLRNFPDALHPGDTGYGIMAKGISEFLTAYANGTYTE